MTWLGFWQRMDVGMPSGKVLIVEWVIVEAEEVNISEVMFNGRRKIVLVDLV